jgi:hypothetical protein
MYLVKTGRSVVRHKADDDGIRISVGKKRERLDTRLHK